jgi:hypothetical protein
MPEKAAIDERELWEFAERTAKKVEDWPAWKKEGWAVLDGRKTSAAMSSSHETNHQLNGEHKKFGSRFD